ncbi:2' O-ribose methyltransferase [Dispira simplex]|nr:2' O-ribose methyltransferase [Dispira simplex]
MKALLTPQRWLITQGVNGIARFTTSTVCSGSFSHSARWLARQKRDPYVKAAQSQQLRARSAFKLRDMDSQYGLLRSGMVVVDCGAAPGGWSTVLADKVYPPDTVLPKPRNTTPVDDHDNSSVKKGEEVENSPCRVLAMDLLPMQPIQGVHFFQMDFTKPESVQRLLKTLAGRPVDLVVSDMAPSFSGNRSVDHLRTMALCEDALVFADQVLRPQGSFVCKFIAGGIEQEFRRMLATKFDKVNVCKPKSSRKESAESFFVCRFKK